MTSEQLATIIACTQLVNRFANLNDANEFDALGELFVPDCVFARPLDPNNPIHGRDAFVAMMKGRGARFLRHVMSNIVIDPVSADEATGLCYITLYATTDVDRPLPMIADAKIHIGEYRDTFVRTAEGWKFKARMGLLTMTQGG
jgi:hypothetical protein